MTRVSYAVCTSAPPEIENGSYEGTDYPATEDIFTYKCNDNYFAHRNYSNNAIATCTSFGNYSVATNDLIKCLPKGFLFINKYLKFFS